MKLIDEKGRLFGKINIFDLIVVLAVVLVVGAVGYKLVQNRKQASGQVPEKLYIATVKCAAMPDTFSAALLKDPRIYYDTIGFTNAKIVGVREEPAVITTQTADGMLVNAAHPSLKDVYIDIEIRDRLDDDDIKIGKYAVAVGGKMTVKTIYAMGADAVVLELNEKQ